MEEITPKQIVQELDKYIVGQYEAKKCVAVALRNRLRRKFLPEDIRDEMAPKNIIMIGPTGVGKTEIARRLAKLVKAPFVKVEATKFTEVGYVGRDVESMVRDLVETSIRMVKMEKLKEVEDKALKEAENKLVELLVPFPQRSQSSKNPFEILFSMGKPEDHTEEESEKYKKVKEQRAIIREKLRRKELEDEIIEIEIEDTNVPVLEIFSDAGMEQMGVNFHELFGNVFPKRKKKRKVTVKEARNILAQQEAEKLIDMEEVKSLGIKKAEETGIIFIDEIDKICSSGGHYGPDVSREGVQRDILPIVEGSTIMTKYGPVKSDHILFIAAGAFHTSKPSDLIPELQGRFPIRVELHSLNEEHFKKILTEPKNSLIRLYSSLLETEGHTVEFKESAVDEIARIAYQINTQTEDIGARRLHTIFERLFEDLFFEAPDLEPQKFIIDREFVRNKLKGIIEDKDLTRYIL
ncbi:MAG: ATP-dependent protease ATPase subunit HslU [Clostridia bacterium 41_269]|nr:MAG: ATP-dependent protease ATPase subunit HslU [Clostridia bacterium 41_269]